MGPAEELVGPMRHADAHPGAWKLGLGYSVSIPFALAGAEPRAGVILTRFAAGDRVRFIADHDVYSSVSVPAGATGVVVETADADDESLIALRVRLDDHDEGVSHRRAHRARHGGGSDCRDQPAVE